MIFVESYILVAGIDSSHQDDETDCMCDKDGQHQVQGVLPEALGGSLSCRAGHHAVKLLQPFCPPAAEKHNF